jgi:hypothetical protein
VPGLPILALAGAWKWRHDARCQVLFASAVMTAVGYMFFPADGGHGWGFRYFHSVWLVLPVLAAGALALRSETQSDERRADIDATRAFVTACALITLLAAVPVSAGLMHEFITAKRAQEPVYPSAAPQVVFIRVPGLDAVDLVQNDPYLRGNVIRMASRGPEADRRLIREHFPDYRRSYADSHGEVWTIERSR